jgi:hypothetical protein
MTFGTFLHKNGIDPSSVLALRHAIQGNKFRKAIGRFAYERRDLFEAHQQAQSGTRADQLMKKPMVASFIGHEGQKARFIGLYANPEPPSQISESEFWAIRENAELRTFGHPKLEHPLFWFELRPMKSYFDLPIEVRWRGERSWSRQADCEGMLILNPEILDDSRIPEEVDAISEYEEGATRQITVNAYERDRKARKKCVDHYGKTCSVCDFDFENVYGKIGAGYIHVHHLRDLATIKTSYKVNPIKDLRPVCPNCHAMLHTETPAMGIERLKRILKNVAGA